MAMTPSRGGSETGMTLVSVLVAVMLLAVGVIAVTRAQTLALRGQTQAALRSTALAVARARMERVRTADPYALADEGAVRVDAAGRPAADGPFVRSVDVVDVDRSLVRVDVRVAFPRNPAPVVLSTLVYRGLR